MGHESLGGDVKSTAKRQPSLIAGSVHPGSARLWRLRISVALFATATPVAGYLAWVSLHAGSVAGCGPQSSCHAVLQSRWAYWFGMPVSLPAMAVYLLMIGLAASRISRISHLREPRRNAESPAVIALCLVVIAAAIWFTALQLFVLHAFCAYCLSAHLAAGIASAIVLFDSFGRHSTVANPPVLRRSVVLAGVLGVTLMVGGQLLVTRATNTVTTLGRSTITTAATPAGRIIALANGLIQLDLAALPRMGTASAPHVAVVLFDYTCSHCRALHGLLVQAEKRFADQLVIVTLPVPLDASCNSLVAQTSAENQHACEYARLGLAVWRTRPEAFERYSSWVFAPTRPPAVESARQYVESLVGADALRTALGDDWIRQQIQINIDLFEANSKRAGAWQMPQLILGNTISVGAVPTVEGLYVLLREHLGLGRAE